MDLNFLNRFSKNPQIPNITKIRSVETGLFHADGQTDMTKLTVAFRNFANEPKNMQILTTSYERITYSLTNTGKIRP